MGYNSKTPAEVAEMDEQELKNRLEDLHNLEEVKGHAMTANDYTKLVDEISQIRSILVDDYDYSREDVVK